MIRFQPKVIIGSLFGIITSVISIIAIFFPSVFNLEKEKINSFEIDLAPSELLFSSGDTYKKLYDFLLKNQDKVVKLNIIYNEYDRKYVNEFNKIYNKDEHFKVDNFAKVNSKFGYAELEDQNANVVSSFIQGTASKNIEFYRYDGTISFFIKENNIPFAINIPYDSDFNKLYKWSAIDIKKKYKMELSGIFFVSKISKEQPGSGVRKLYMPRSYSENACSENSNCSDIDIFTLYPVSPKDLAAGKY